MTRTTQPEAAAGLPEDEDFIVEGTGQLSIAAMQSLTDANPQQEAGAELSGNAGDLALETAIDWMELAAAMLGRGEMPAPGSAYAANWCMAHGVVLEAARRSMSQPQQEGASLPGGEGLKPCPMCGSGIIRERLALGESWVRCDDCGMTTDMFGSHERAIAAWNRRPEPPSLPADGSARPELTVWYGKMPESNGRENWTAILGRNDTDIHLEGFCFARSEYPGRVQYEADEMRWIIGELPERPDILAYDADAHSGYVEPQTPAPTTLNSGEALAWQDADSVAVWSDGIITDGESVAFAQKAEADYGGTYWATDDGDGGIGWTPTHFATWPPVKAALRPAGDYEGLLDWLSKRTNLELSYSYGDEDGEGAGWQIHEVSGGRSDREWTLKATGETPAAALRQLTAPDASMKGRG